MKRLLTGFAVVSVAVVWMVGSWYFFNSIADGAQGPATPPTASASSTGSNSGPVDHHGRCGEHWKHYRWHHSMWRKLHLSEAQRKQIKTIISEERAKMKPMLQQLKSARDQLRALRKSGPFDEAKVRAIAKGQAGTLVNLIVEREHMKARINAVLTPEQRAKAERLRESWKARARHWWKKHG